jgi:hypothetical protein
MIDKHQQIVEKLRSLPPERIDEVIDFIDFIDGCEKRKAGVTFDEWAMNLAKKKGFHHLTEEDITEIVKQCRSGA